MPLSCRGVGTCGRRSESWRLRPGRAQHPLQKRQGEGMPAVSTLPAFFKFFFLQREVGTGEGGQGSIGGEEVMGPGLI